MRANGEEGGQSGGDTDRAGLYGTVWASGEEGGQRGGRDPDRAGLCGLTGRREDRAGVGTLTGLGCVG